MEDNLKITRIEENNVVRFRELVTLLNKVFEEPHKVASDNQLQQLLNDPKFYVIVATKNEKVIGGLTAYELPRYYTNKSELYIYDIAVKTEFQNQGIGKKLIGYTKDHATKNGIEGIFVDAHSEDEQAVKFYETTLGQSEKVDHFNFEIKNADNTK